MDVKVNVGVRSDVAISNNATAIGLEWNRKQEFLKKIKFQE